MPNFWGEFIFLSFPFFELFYRYVIHYVKLMSFLSFCFRPVIIEVPHFGSLRGREREIVILRSDNGETWREHTVEASEEAVHDVLNESFEKDGERNGEVHCAFSAFFVPHTEHFCIRKLSIFSNFSSHSYTFSFHFA